MLRTKYSLLFAGALVSTLVAACGSRSGAGDISGASLTDSYPKVDAKWSTGAVQVCWESSADNFPTEKQWVENKVKAQYNGRTNVRFFGWDSCYSGSPGVHVSISDNPGDNPHTQGLGREVNGMDNGMQLNFTFYNWSQSCQNDRESCIEAIAVHEFGHSIGLAHEQNRPDTPETCKEQQPAQGENGDTLIGKWDTMSVMNYCNPIYNGGGNLSSGDLQGINYLYPVLPAGF